MTLPGCRPESQPVSTPVCHTQPYLFQTVHAKPPRSHTSTHTVIVHVLAHPHSHLLYSTHTWCRTWWTGGLAQSVPLDGLHSMIHTVIYSCESHSVYTQPNNAVIIRTPGMKEEKNDSNVWNRVTEKISLAHFYLQIMLCFNFRSYYVVFGLDPSFKPDANWCV